MKNKNKIISPLLFLLLCIIPIFFVTMSGIVATTNSFDYDMTLLANIEAEAPDSAKSFVLTFDDNRKSELDNYDNFSKVFNKDFYGINTIFRSSKESISISSENNERQEEAIFSDIYQCDIQNNRNQNFSSLKIDVSMDNFQDDSIFISDKLASSLSISVGDIVCIALEEEAINLNVLGIYSKLDNTGRFINNVYFELNNPLCFVSKSVFDKVSSKNYDSFACIGIKEDYLQSTYRELAPFLSSNNVSLTVPDGFSVNNFDVKKQSMKDFQTSLLKMHNDKNVVLYSFCVICLILFFISIVIIGYIVATKLINENNFVFNHIISLNFVYSIFVIGLSVLAASILKSSFASFTSGDYQFYRSLKTPLLFISAFTIIYLGVVYLSSFIVCRKKTKELELSRIEEISRMKKSSNKVIFVTGSLSRGGAEKVIVELANYYASIGREVDIVILLNNVVAWDIDKRINVINFTGNTNSRIKRIKYWITNLKRYFGENKNATIVSFLVRVNLLVLLSAKKKEHKIIISERNDPRYDGRGIIVSSLVNYLYPKADTIVFQTKECLALFKKSIQRKGIVLSNPIRINSYASPKVYKENYFVSAGRITEQKNQITMINAMAIVVKQYPDVVLEIYGDGDLTDRLNKKIASLGLQNNVFILPNIKEINEKILNSMAYVCTSLYEGMSNSLMEASFAGIPCITTKCLGTDFIKNKENGLFIDFESPKELAKVIISIVSNKEEYAKLREQSISIAKCFKHDDIYAKWKEHIDNNE